MMRRRRPWRSSRARALGGLAVTRVLDRLALTRGLPQVLRTDNAFLRRTLAWFAARGIAAHERCVMNNVLELNS